MLLNVIRARILPHIIKCTEQHHLIPQGSQQTILRDLLIRLRGNRFAVRVPGRWPAGFRNEDVLATDTAKLVRLFGSPFARGGGGYSPVKVGMTVGGDVVACVTQPGIIQYRNEGINSNNRTSISRSAVSQNPIGVCTLEADSSPRR
jgi:hypothetical protein